VNQRIVVALLLRVTLRALALSGLVSCASVAAGDRADYGGSAACKSCHAAEYAVWQRSHHAQAMQHASRDTVLGDFSGVSHTEDGVNSSFFMREGRYFVRTDGPDGRLADFEVKYTFGTDPLQQYLVELPGGRLQALSLSWDARPARDGGQHWFRQYAGQHIDHRDELHWTRPSQNWNGMCADCHAVDVRKSYDAARDRFDSSWAELGVGCESCHGPAAAHIDWARRGAAPSTAPALALRLTPARPTEWTIDPASGNARPQPATRERAETAVCITCHSRRAQFAEGHRPGDQLLDHFLPATLTSGLFHADGQQQDEVFTWASFAQSRMHAAGVGCGDCHEPHGQHLRLEGDAVCTQCHESRRYATEAHHRHESASPAVACVNCHMPATTYMGVDARRDHAVRVPRPDLSVALGTPDPCTGCHEGKSPRWAIDAITRWYGQGRRREAHYGTVLDAGRRGGPGAARELVKLAVDPSRPAILRATALEMLPAYPSALAHEASVSALQAEQPLIRLAGVRGLQPLPLEGQVALLKPLLRDPVRAIRIAVAPLLAPAQNELPQADRAALDASLAEYVAVQEANLDRPESYVNLGNLYVRLGDVERAQRAYQAGIASDAGHVPAYVNLADLWRALGREDEAENTLRLGLAARPGVAALQGALGLSLVRQGRKEEALRLLQAAVDAAPSEPRHAYLLALALDDAGRRADALEVLERAVAARGDRHLLLTLAALRRADGDEPGARAALDRLAAVNPDDPAFTNDNAP
jgi:tetratricopeptide (TPR) repeat protein